MQKQQLTKLFKKYDPQTRKVLREVLRLEQQYITNPLRTNSSALRELREKIDGVLERTVNS